MGNTMHIGIYWIETSPLGYKIAQKSTGYKEKLNMPIKNESLRHYDQLNEKNV